MSLALYRKYRPAAFAEVVGQDHVTVPLTNALRAGRLHHAYLFSGPRGCGKTSSARILARSLNCAAGPTPEPCGTCDSCVALAPGGAGSLDVIEIDAASHNGVDDARDLRERAFYAPVSSRFKVYVIDEAHMVTTAAFNALLKLVEEPPDFVTFVFATTEPDKVLQTIKSRTHHYPFRLVPPTVLRGLLEDICRKEGVRAEPAVLPLVVRAGGGSVRDSLSILDQLFAGAGPEGVTYGRAVALLGVTDAALLDEVVEALATGDGAAVFEAIERVVEAGHDPRRFATDLLERLRDLLVLDAVPDAAAKGLIDAPTDQLERMGGQAVRLGRATLSRMADVVHDGLVQMKGTTAPRLLLELVCARMLLPAAATDSGAVLQRLERLERRLDIAGPEGAGAPASSVAPSGAPPPRATPPAGAPVSAAPAARPRTEPPPTPPPPTQTAPTPPHAEPPSTPAAPPASAPPAPPGERPPTLPPPVPDAAAVRRVWPEIVAVARRRKPTVGAYLLDGTVTAVEGDTLVLTFPHVFHARALSQSPAAELFRAALREVLGVEWQVRCEVAGAAVSDARQGGQRIDLTVVDAEPDPGEGDPGDGVPEVSQQQTGRGAPSAGGRRDSEESAISLLSRSLGARPIGDG